MELPYLVGLLKEVYLDVDGKTIRHDRFGKGCIVVFQTEIIRLSFPADFTKKSLFTIV